MPFVEKWRWSGSIHNLFGPPIIAISKDRVIIATTSQTGKEKVVAFDAYTGNQVWESDSKSNLRSLHADDKRVYVGAIRYVWAYDLETGDLVWEYAEQDINKRGGLLVFSEGERLKVFDSYNDRFLLLDSANGNLLDEIEYPGLIFQNEGIDYLSEGSNFIAKDSLTSNTMWSHEFSGKIYLWPAFVGNTIVVNAGEHILAINIQTGKIDWQITEEKFVTSSVVGDNQLYILRDDAAIVGLEPGTGNEVGIIEISPTQNIEFTGGDVPYYTIVSSDQFVAAYYSNSQELIIFGK